MQSNDSLKKFLLKEGNIFSEEQKRTIAREAGREKIRQERASLKKSQEAYQELEVMGAANF